MALKVLLTLDNARTQYYHFKAIIIAGMGMFTDAYDLFCIPPIMTLIGHIYYDNHQVPDAVSSAMVAMALGGAAIGKLVFGRLGDLIGRRRMYGFALLMMVLSSLGCGFSVCKTRPCVLLSLGFFRFLLGIGIGGDYPLSATIMSEFANRRTRGGFIAAVFSMQGLGILVSSMVTMMVCAIFNRESHSPSKPTPPSADLAWRLIVMLGAIPAALTCYWRIKMPETARYTALVERNVLQATEDMGRVLDVPVNEIIEKQAHPPNPPSYPLFSKEFFRRHGRDLFACSIAWFLVDVVFYSSNLFQSRIYKPYLTEDLHEGNAFDEAYRVARLQAIIAICSTIPGYWATVLCIDKIGRVKIQIMGFFFMALGLFAIGIPYSYWDKAMKKKSNHGFLVLYGLTFFFSNFGPNTTTFIVPAELFPARFRSTCHGISGAVGKVGAIIGSVAFIRTSEGKGMTAPLLILGCVCVVGMVTTYLFTRETKGRSLEDNEREDETTGMCFLRGCSCCGRRQSSANEVTPA